MDITLLPPTHILSNHSHLSTLLLPSPFPRYGTHQTQSSSYPPTRPHTPFSTYTYRRKTYESKLPTDGSSPISQLPDEIILSILSYLDWDQLLSIRATDQRINHLALAPVLHQTLALLSLPPGPIPPVFIKHILPQVRHLHLHLFPYPSSFHTPNRPPDNLLELLEHIPTDQLISLSLPFSAPYLPGNELGRILQRIGGRLEKLDLRGSGLTGGRWLDWLSSIGTAGRGRGLRELDLGFTGISTFPNLSFTDSPKPDLTLSRRNPFANLTSLSLASCSHLPLSPLADFLRNLPETIARLDLSRLDQITFAALWDMRVTTEHNEWGEKALMPTTTALREVKVVGIDHLTRVDVRRLKIHWEGQRRPRAVSTLAKPVNISYSRLGTSSVFGRGTALLSPPITPRTNRLLSPSLSSSSSSSPSYSSSSSGTWSSSTNTSNSQWTKHTSLLHLSNSNAYPPTPQSTPPPRTPHLQHHHHQHRHQGQEGDSQSINIVHSAILESEDEAGYRQFIGEVVGGTLAPGFGFGLEGVEGDREVEGGRKGYVEVDLGGMY